MDALLADLQVVCSQLLPVLGAVALIFLCIFLKKLAALMDTVNHTIQSLDPTLQKVNQSIDKVQAPLDTAVKYSHTLDKVHDKAGMKHFDILSESTQATSRDVMELVGVVRMHTGAPLRSYDLYKKI